MNPLGRYFTLAVLCVAGLAFAAAAPEQAAWQYIGAKKCKTCHNSSKKGAQFKSWMSTKHAEAYATLATPEALEMAAEKGIENPQEADECLECHVTGHGKSAEHFAKTFDKTLGVQCESCHGAGSGYYKKKQMKEITAGTVAPEKYGLVIPTAETCASCHNERSPSGKFVDWAADSAKIAHPFPPGSIGGDDDEGEEDES